MGRINSSYIGDSSIPLKRATQLRGDIAVQGFWSKSNLAIFDVRRCHTNAPSIKKSFSTPAKALANAEKIKKEKYLKDCLAKNWHFSPFVVSIDGMLGTEANMILKKLAEDQAEKTGAPRSVLINWLRTQLSFALLRGNFRCLFGSRQSLFRHKMTLFEDEVFYKSQSHFFDQMNLL